MATAFAEETKKEVEKDVTSLRSALEWLDTQGDVLRTDVEVDPDLEITGVQKHLDGGPARVRTSIFPNLKPACNSSVARCLTTRRMASSRTAMAIAMHSPRRMDVTHAATANGA